MLINAYQSHFLVLIVFITASILNLGCSDPELPGLSESLNESTSSMQVIDTLPEDQEENIGLETPIQAIFSAPIDTNSINASSFIVREGSNDIAGSFSYLDSAATFIPEKTLTRDALIHTIITTQVADTDGNTMNQDYEWTFTTRPPTTYEATPPVVIAISPKAGASDIPVNAQIYASFSKALNPESINNNTFILQRGSTKTSGSVNYDDSTAVFNPSGLLRHETTYTAIITNNIEDLFGNTLTENHNWSFTTKERDRKSPRILETFPRDNARNISTDVQITAIFNEPMDPATITDVTFQLYQRRRGGYRQISGSVDYADRTARFSPERNLRDEEDYVVVISASVTDLAGNALGETYRWSFKTEDD